MRAHIWRWLRNSRILRSIHQVSVARQPMNWASRMLLPSSHQNILKVRKGPGAGLRFELNPRWEIALWEGRHELQIQEWIANRLKTASVFYDVGAGFGFYSCLAARLGADVFAFEPDEANARAVARHTEFNGLNDRVQLLRLAVLNKTGIVQFKPASQDRGHGNSAVANAETAGGLAFSVRCMSLDEFAVTHPLPDLIKIDVEGAESMVLEGARQLFERSHPQVICEVHDGDNEVKVCQWFEDRGYEVSKIGNAKSYPIHVLAYPRQGLKDF